MKPHLAAITLALLLSADPGLAQTTGTPGTSTGFITQQPANEWLASLFVGQSVTNPAGETVGDINDLLFDKSGRISTVVLGVGGFLGIAERNVAVPFGLLTFSTGKDGERVVSVSLSKEELEKAPKFTATEKSPFVKAKEKAGELGEKATEKAGELKDKVLKKIEEMRKDEPKVN